MCKKISFFPKGTKDFRGTTQIPAYTGTFPYDNVYETSFPTTQFRKPAPVGTSIKSSDQKRLQPVTFSLCGDFFTYFSPSQPFADNTFIVPYPKRKSSTIPAIVAKNVQKTFGIVCRRIRFCASKSHRKISYTL